MTNAMSAILLGFVLVGLSLPGPSLAARLPRSGTTLTALQRVVAANNDFAMDLYSQIRGISPGENIFFSPFSVSSALAMVYAGANGNTETEMGEAMNLDGINGVDGAFRDLFETFNDPTNNYTLSVANAFFGRDEYPFLDAYLNLVTQYYSALVETLDFEGSPETSRLYINDWVADNTNQKIMNLLGPRSIHERTAAVLVNTIYFKGLWKTPFDADDTTERTFITSPTKRVRTNMMNLKAARFNYAEVNSLSCKIIELPYGGDEVSMYVLLPNADDGLTALESQLTSTGLDNVISSMTSTKVDVSIPKFQMTLKVGLKGILQSLGMHDLFVPTVADLSGMDGTRKLVVSSVVHKAYIDVNEEGTEAAAATGIVVAITSVQPDPKTFKADHPFLFFIRDKVTGSILFSGSITEPPQADDDKESEEPGIGDVESKPRPGWYQILCKLVGCGAQRRRGGRRGGRRG